MIYHPYSPVLCYGCCAMFHLPEVAPDVRVDITCTRCGATHRASAEKCPFANRCMISVVMADPPKDEWLVTSLEAWASDIGHHTWGRDDENLDLVVHEVRDRIHDVLPALLLEIIRLRQRVAELETSARPRAHGSPPR